MYHLSKRAFMALVQRLAPGSNIMSRKTLFGRINTKFAQDMFRLHYKLNAVDAVRTNSYIWPVKNIIMVETIFRFELPWGQFRCQVSGNIAIITLIWTKS